MPLRSRTESITHTNALLACVALCAVSYALPPLYLFDFTLVWKSARELLFGHNPYARPHYALFVSDYPWFLAPSPSAPDIRTYYPPPGIVLFLPFALVPLWLAKKLFVALFCLALFGSALLSRRVAADLTGARGLLPPGWHLVLFPAGLAISALTWGSPSCVLAFSLALALYALVHGRTALAGILFSTLVLKPHLSLPVLLYAGISALRSREFGFLKGLGVGLIMLTGAALLLRPTIFQEYVGELLGSPPTFMTNASLPSTLAAAFPEIGSLLRTFPWLCLLAGVTVAARGQERTALTRNIILLLPASLFLSPFTWGHDYLLCFPFLYLAGAALRERPAPGAVMATVLLVLNAVIPLALAYSFFVPGWSYICCGALLVALLYLHTRRGRT